MNTSKNILPMSLVVVCLLLFAVSALPTLQRASNLQQQEGEDAEQLMLSSENLAPKRLQERKVTDAGVGAKPLSEEYEQARQIWSGFRKLQLQLRPKRFKKAVSTHLLPPVSVPAGVDDINAPKYILELYKNLTKYQPSVVRPQTRSANTIRTLEAVENSNQSSCKLFNFTLSSINSSEFIVKAELHLYLREDISHSGSVFVGIKEYGVGNDWISQKELYPNFNDSRFNVFSVDAVISGLVDRGAKYVVLEAQVFEKRMMFDESQHSDQMSCQKISFVHHKTDNKPEAQPLLVVYSYDPEVNKVDYRAIINHLNRTETNISNPTRRDTARTKRSSDNETVICNLFDLTIKKHEIPKKVHEMILLPDNYSAGICGGNCGLFRPTTTSIKHLTLINLLQGSAEFRDRHGYEVTRCCAPISYAPLEVLMVSNGNVLIQIMPNMKILECECIEVVDLKSTSVR